MRPPAGPPAADFSGTTCASGADRIATSACWSSLAFEAESCCDTAISANTIAAATPITAKPVDGVSSPARRNLRRGAAAFGRGDGRALGPRGRDDAIAQVGGRLAVGHRQGQRGRRLESIFVGAAAIVAGGDVPLGERSLVGVERAQGVRADQRGDLLGNLVFTHA